MAKRAAGAGSIVKLKKKDPETGKTIEGKYWYVLYRVNGRQIRESSESETYSVAEALLQRRLGEAGLGVRPEQDVKNVKYDEVAKAYIDQQRADGVTFFQKADGTEYLRGVPNLDKFFKARRVIDISTDVLRRYIESRTKEGASGPTIRRELVTLRSMLNLARKEGKLRLADIPYFPMPPDSKPRKGFLNPDAFAKLLAALPSTLRPLVLFTYCTGMRRGAALKITWDMLNEDCTEFNIPGDILKNDEPITLPLVGEDLRKLAAMLKKQFRVQGQPVFDATNLRKDWATACHGLGLGAKDGWRYSGLMLHDLRRSAVRNLVRAGVPESVAMKISGHKTRHVFERYNIVDTRDVREALVKVGEYSKVQRRGSRLAQMPKVAKERAR